ncbi:aminoacyl tRNA synthase complex-interacting multifunctional protein 2 [Nilaparvata lugens]|uniref:aminoacyl tRNA synthase complex-interacting multifunctional protein 2 n=1 Tax=Nilaparvata lugens TaxID=108931 RepID=UPI00193DF2A7|nr:aminoacyl tRNA synthase complex-interacting multifunctional protein 2 [Nilaparvata lugens]
MNGPLPNKMYQIKPVFCLPDNLETSSNMYKMKSIHNTSFQASNPIKDENTVALEKTPNNEYDDIHKRQKIILQQLTDLQNQMSVFRERLSSEKVVPVKNSRSVPDIKPNTATMKPRFEEGGVIYDVVINANPKHPPYSLLAINKLWGDKLKVRVNSHVHSTIATFPKVNELFQVLHDNNNNGCSQSSLNITLVWKETSGPDLELITSPLHHTAIRGEVNLLRYLHRHLQSHDDTVAATRLDSLLDRCHGLRHASTAKEKKAGVKAANAALGKGQWLGGGEMGVADVALWSVVKCDGDLELTQSLQKWVDRCNNAIGIGA